tara:strand:+ start:650 stop:1282 length:633 start_codon:yes stop_codon:yes gene_type:complete
MNKINNIFLKGHSIFLRPIEEEDVTNGEWHAWFNDAELTKYNSHGVFPINIEDERKHHKNLLNDKTQISLTVCSLDYSRIIGTASLLNIDLLNRKAEVSCMIAHNINTTVALESLGLLVQHGFEKLNLNKIYGGANYGLKDWVKMMETLGFKKEGVRKQEFLRDNKYIDLIDFCVFSKDYLKIKKSRNNKYLFDSKGKLYKDAISKLKSK